jgi:Zn finger protein HypA/HybF involved in hydrogenase expression
VKKEVLNVCRYCANSFQGPSGSYRCPKCKKKELQYKAQREKVRKSLPYYLKTDI